VNPPLATISFTEAIDRLPSMPSAVVEIIRCIEDENVEIETLAEWVSHDIGLSASLLRVANSAQFSEHGSVSTLHDAIMLVGFKQIRSLVCAVGLIRTFPATTETFFDYNGFWRHSLSVAVCARLLAKDLRVNPDTAFICGLLHDIGKLALVLAAPADFRDSLAYADAHHCALAQAEQVTLGLNHSQLGARLARKWALPAIICETIATCHSPDAAPATPMSDLVHVSQVLCATLGLGANERIVTPLSDLAMARLNLTLFHLKPYFAAIEFEYENAVRILN